MMGPAVVAVCAALAFANGANDVSKGVATLVGSGITNYRRAVAWGTLWTGAGSVLALYAASAMLATFGGGVLAAGVTLTISAALAALIGAAAWVAVATVLRLPVSTTHALVGASVGAALVGFGPQGVAWTALGSKVVLPLLLSPVLALVLSRLVMSVMAPGGGAAAECVCVTPVVPVPVGVAACADAEPGLAGEISPTWMMRTGTLVECREERAAAFSLTVDHLHWLSSGALSLARGLNDAPKLVALGLAALALGAPGTLTTSSLYGWVTAAMLAGSLVAGLRVTRVLAQEVTVMNHTEGLAANAVSAILVGTGAAYGLPMSTTHVSSGGIMGIGSRRGALQLSTVRHILWAWVVTVPVSATLAAAAYGVVYLVTRGGW